MDQTPLLSIVGKAPSARDPAPPQLFRPSCHTEAPGLAGRCLFAIHCLSIRLLALPAGSDASPCLAGCCGIMLISHGTLELRSSDTKEDLKEGDSIALLVQHGVELWPGKATDIVLFERR